MRKLFLLGVQNKNRLLLHRLGTWQKPEISKPLGKRAGEKEEILL